ncbi:adh short domain containing protein [Trichuris trichiura]|uniref:3-ketoacyl-[acyl-carrier-protein] reductase beta subunit n=1 Tax=Trichuris trichiura TaxID=36087 RepID=A0A077Z666_TRITR|nr:adh short domain containing protein [Trichuris trichiura]
MITGGARGIGRAVAIRAAKEGANIVIADWLAQKGKETASEIIAIGGNAIALDIDVSKTEDAERMVQEAVNAFGRIDYALNAAGHSHLITAPIHSSLRAELKQMIKQGQGGAIVNIASAVGIVGISYMPAYTATIDYAKYGIRVNSVNMGNTDTDALLIENGIHAQPKRPLSTVWEQASIILLLLSDEASNLTGSVYATDGGYTAY